MQTGLEGKTAFVTEAAGNFGRATALAFANEGANLVLASSEGNDLLEQTAHEASQLGVRVVTGHCDVSSGAQVPALVERGLSEFGHLDVLVNNALFLTPVQSLEEISFELWKRKISVEVTGTLLVCQEVLPGMIERRWGRVINYTGLAAFQGTEALTSTAQLGVVGLTRGIAREYGKYNITANCVGPGGVNVEEEPGVTSYPPDARDPLPRWGEPGEIAFLTVCLASEGSGYITGQCLLANGGKHFL